MNKKEAYLCAQAATAAYNNRCDAPDFSITAKFENKGTDTQGIFGVANNNTFVVSFRGSEETGLADWLTDARFGLVPFPYGRGLDNQVKVHQGFLEAYQSVREAVISSAKDTPHKRVICTGHSLGGGLATLCALDMTLNTTSKTIYCYTYGSPAVGNGAFAAAYRQHVPQTFRVVNGSDVVPALPPGAYEHIGQLCQVGSEADSDSWLGEIVDNLIGTIEDHLPPNYIKALRDLL